MIIQKIEIKNILGIEYLEINAGKFTLIEGRNAVGKSSIIEAIKTVLQGGADVTLIRKGASEGEVGLLLDNGTSITKTIKANKQGVGIGEVTIKDKNGIEINKPMTFISTLIDSFAINPIEFLFADDKTRTNLLFEAVPTKVNPEILEKIKGVGEIQKNIQYLYEQNLHPISFFNTSRSLLYDTRTGVNRSLKDKRATITMVEKTLSEEDETEIMRQTNEARKELEVAQQKKEEYSKAIEAEYSDKVNEANEWRKEKYNELNNSFQEKLVGLKSNLAVLEEKARQAIASTENKNTLTSLKEGVSKLEQESKALTATIELLDIEKTRMLNNIPIKNLEVVDGIIYLGGVPFKRVNTAEQIKTAIEVAKLKSGELKIVCVDGIERLDSEQFEIFRQEAEKSDIQLIITKVTDTDLNIN